MKAIVYERYGPPGVLRVEERQAPSPRDSEVKIRVRAVEATKSDCELRAFHFPVKWFWLPMRLALGITRPKRQILGGYFAGEIEAIGAKVTTMAPGDEVFGCAGLRLGAYGQYVCLPETSALVPKPTNMSFEEAAAVPLGGLNALHFLRLAAVQRGERVLINGAGGSIGIFGLQIAKAMGAEVTAVDAAIKEGLLRRLGADHFIDYAEVDFTRAGKTYDVIFDMVVSSSYLGCLRALNPKGRYLTGNPRLSKMLASTFMPWFTGKPSRFAFAGERKEELFALKAMIEAGEIRAAIDQVLPMEGAAEAHGRVETERRLGSVVIAL